MIHEHRTPQQSNDGKARNHPEEHIPLVSPAEILPTKEFTNEQVADAIDRSVRTSPAFGIPIGGGPGASLDEGSGV